MCFGIAATWVGLRVGLLSSAGWIKLIAYCLEPVRIDLTFFFETISRILLKSDRRDNTVGLLHDTGIRLMSD